MSRWRMLGMVEMATCRNDSRHDRGMLWLSRLCIVREIMGWPSVAPALEDSISYRVAIFLESHHVFRTKRLRRRLRTPSALRLDDMIR